MERSLIRFLRLFFRFHQFIELYFTKAFIVDGFERKKIQHFALLTWLLRMTKMAKIIEQMNSKIFAEKQKVPSGN